MKTGAKMKSLLLLANWKSSDVKSSHYEAALSDREHQYCLISGVMAWKDWRVGVAVSTKM
jgi:hypothetical protein